MNSLSQTPIDLIIPAPAGSLMRSCMLNTGGVYRISRRDAELYSVLNLTTAWGKLKITDQMGRMIFHLPSLFTGSFYLLAGSEGLIVYLNVTNIAAVQINWREQDGQLI